MQIEADKVREACRERQEIARSLLMAEGLQGLVIVGRAFYDRPGSLAYLTNHFPPFPTAPLTRDVRGLGHAVFVLPRDPGSIATLVVDSPGYRRNLIAVEDVRVSPNLSETVGDVLLEQGWRSAVIGIVGEDVLPSPVLRDWQNAFPDITWVGADRLLERQRRIKSPLEQALLRQAAAVADATYAAVLPTVQAGQSERALCAQGIATAINAGADFVRYFRVHSGEWSAWGSRWPPATERVVQEGDLLTMDIIGAVNGYQFDVLRSTVAGTPPERALGLLEAAADATAAMVRLARAGITVEGLVAAAQRSLAASGFAEYAASFFGHGIGLDTMEPPYLRAGAQDVLEAGMVLCLEPAIHIPRFGGACVEEEVIITADGCEVITRTPPRPWRRRQEPG